MCLEQLRWPFFWNSSERHLEGPPWNGELQLSALPQLGELYSLYAGEELRYFEGVWGIPGNFQQTHFSTLLPPGHGRSWMGGPSQEGMPGVSASTRI